MSIEENGGFVANSSGRRGRRQSGSLDPCSPVKIRRGEGVWWPSDRTIHRQYILVVYSSRPKIAIINFQRVVDQTILSLVKFI